MLPAATAWPGLGPFKTIMRVLRTGSGGIGNGSSEGDGTATGERGKQGSVAKSNVTTDKTCSGAGPVRALLDFGPVSRVFLVVHACCEGSVATCGRVLVPLRF